MPPHLALTGDLSLMMTAISSYHWFYGVNMSQGTAAIMHMRSVRNFSENLLLCLQSVKDF